MYAYTASPGSVTVLFPEVGSRTILSTSPNFERVKEALHSEDWGSLLDLMDPTKSIKEWGSGSLDIINGMIHIDGVPLASQSLSNKVLQMWEEGFPIDPYIEFNKKLQELSSHRISTVLYEYLERHSFPLFNDGAFMAYKGLIDNPYKGKDITEEMAKEVYGRSPQNPHTSINGKKLSDLEYYIELLGDKDYVDVHSRSVPQSIGDTVSMETRQVNDDPSQGCSTGLHVGSHTYTNNYAIRTLVKVYPVNCIAVPLDCSFSKIRVDKYTLMGVDTTAKVEHTSAVFSATMYISVRDDESSDYDEDEDEDYYDDDEE